MTNIGFATLSVIPSFEGFRRNVDQGTGSALAAAGRSGGQQFGREASKAMTAAGADAGEKFGTEAAEAGAESFGSKIKDGIKKGALAAGTAAGLALGVGIGGALERGRLGDRLAAQLGVGEKKSAELGKVAGDLYSDAYGDSLEGVNGALRAVVTNLDGFRNASKSRLKDVTATVLDLNAAFDEEPEAIARAASQMVRTDLAKGPKQALDIITRGFQVGADKSQDLLDTFNEYGTQFRKLGLNGKRATGLLAQGLQGGARDADIVADSLKEFTLKTQEATTKTQQLAGGKTALNLSALGEAFEAVGVEVLTVDGNLSKAGETFQDDLAGGGDKARAALDKVLDGLRQIDDPLERNRTAVALFGTQAEDMGDALYSLDLDTAAKELGNVSGAAKDMGETLSDNAATKIEGFKRKVKTSLVDFIANEFIPFFENDVQPILEDFSGWFKRDGADALRDFGGDVKDVTAKVSDLVGFLNDLPKPAKVAGILALVGGISAAKLTGGGGGALGTAGKVLGLAKPVPVFVTNKGFGTGGVPGADGPDGKPKPGKVASTLGTAAKYILPVAVSYEFQKNFPEFAPFGDKGFLPGSGTGEGRGWMSWFADDPEPVKKTAAEIESANKLLDLARAKAAGFGTELDLVGARKINPTFKKDQIERANDALYEFVGLQQDANRPIAPYLTINGYERAMQQIRTLTAGIRGIPTAGTDNGVPYVGAGGAGGGRETGGTGGNGRVAASGVVIDQRGATIVAHDYDDFTGQLQKKAQAAGLGGRP